MQARLDAESPALAAEQAHGMNERAGPAPRWTAAAAEAGGLGAAAPRWRSAADGTITASGANPDRDTYTLIAPLRARAR